MVVGIESIGEENNDLIDDVRDISRVAKRGVEVYSRRLRLLGVSYSAEGMGLFRIDGVDITEAT